MSSGRNNLENLARAGQLAAEPTRADEVALDRYHDRRNAAEYEAAPPASVAEAKDLVELAARLRKLVTDGIRRSHPALLK